MRGETRGKTFGLLRIVGFVRVNRRPASAGVRLETPDTTCSSAERTHHTMTIRFDYNAVMA
ncbi:MAG TPA: hypothetical protein PKH31_09430, partial [Candidatus Sumerlaeota bacterium]|nr:hypothetical protein [Candidatus Sumerlaeota bacterium]